MFKNENIENQYSKSSWRNENEKNSKPNGKPLAMHKGKNKAYFLEWIEFVKVCPTCETKILCDYWDYQKVKKEVECPECLSTSEWPSTASDVKHNTKFDFQTSLIKYKKVDLPIKKSRPHTIRKVSEEVTEEPEPEIIDSTNCNPINLDGLDDIKHCFEVQAIAKQKRYQEIIDEDVRDSNGELNFAELSKYTKLAKQCVLKIYIDNFVTDTKFVKSRKMINDVLNSRTSRNLTQPETTKYLNELGVYEKSGERKIIMTKSDFQDRLDDALKEVIANENKNPKLFSQIEIALDKGKRKGLPKVKKRFKKAKE